MSMKSLFSFFFFFFSRGGIKCNATQHIHADSIHSKIMLFCKQTFYTGFSQLNHTKLHFFSAFVMATTKQDTNGLCTHRENERERERSTYLLDSSKSLILVMKMLPLLLVDATAASVRSLLETNSFGFFLNVLLSRRILLSSSSSPLSSILWL